MLKSTAAPATEDRIWVQRLPLPASTFSARELRGIAISIAALGLISIEQYRIGEAFTISAAQAKRVEPLFRHGLL